MRPIVYRIKFCGKPTNWEWKPVPGQKNYTHFDRANEAAGRLAASHEGIYVYVVLKGLAGHVEAARYGSHEPNAIESPKSKIDQLRKALEPFAKLLQSHHDSYKDNLPVISINDVSVTIGDLRKANEVLGGEK
jgi:hypothetical protein